MTLFRLAKKFDTEVGQPQWHGHNDKENYVMKMFFRLDLNRKIQHKVYIRKISVSL